MKEPSMITIYFYPSTQIMPEHTWGERLFLLQKAIINKWKLTS